MIYNYRELNVLDLALLKARDQAWNIWLKDGKRRSAWQMFLKTLELELSN